MCNDAVCVSDNQTPWAPSAERETGRLRFRYACGMRSRGIGWVVLGVLAAMSVVVVGSPAAHLGSGFADVYTAYAPLYAFYRSYADHLFHGTAVEVPAELTASCGRFSYQLALFHLEYSVQTGSATAGGLAYLARLRAESTAFCDEHADTIEAIDGLDEVDAEVLGAASEEGLFAGIKRINDLLEIALDEILDGLGEGVERWTFAVTFSMRSLLNRSQVERLDANLREILYGDPEGTAPPFAVPDDVASAMERLVDLCERDLAEGDVDEAFGAARAIYEHFVGGP